MLSDFLVKFDTVYWINEEIKYLIHDIDKTLIIPLSLLLFFYLHYFFVSTTAYVSTLFAPFLIILLNFDLPANMSVMVLSTLAIISGGLTHYTIGTAPGYFSISGIKVSKWCKLGLYVATVNLLIWFIGYLIWWKVIGWY